MSSGPFSVSKYEADDGTIYPIKIQPETLTANLGAVNAAPSGAATGKVLAKARKNRRAYGVGARTARVKFTAAVPDGYSPNQILTIPVLTPTVYNGITANATTGTYLGSPVLIVGKSSETVR